MVFDGILISIIVGFFRKGSLRGLADLQLKYGWIFPILVFLQFFIYFLQNKYELLGFLSGYIFMFVYVIGMAFLWVNRHNSGFTLILIGTFLNFLVMALNGGRMPVLESAAALLDPHYLDTLKNELYAKHTLLTESSRLGFLGDIIPLTNPYPRSQVISIGDVVMNIGIFQYIQYLMVHKSKDAPIEGETSFLKEVKS
ncbi:DUF5317 domain-containing protein [Fredinandcohnia onubensis]|uniref:DUF5317 domain-containing protein n=1 Tax=Fredinandcohnia onubensis TaxID=1571209 RepID=UPI000C0BC516|nr:DUF5317 domain-containing protein [Fredinandcohnia onubensis]